MTASEEEDIPKDLFKDVTFYIVGDIAENVRFTSLFTLWAKFMKLGGVNMVKDWLIIP